MATHSSTLAWKIPWTEEPGRLQSMGLLRVGYDWATSLSLFTFMHWRRKWQPTPVFLPGESQGRRSLVGCHLWGHTESVMTEVTQQQQQSYGDIGPGVDDFWAAPPQPNWGCRAHEPVQAASFQAPRISGMTGPSSGMSLPQGRQPRGWGGSQLYVTLGTSSLFGTLHL